MAPHRRVIAGSETWHQVYPRLAFSSANHHEVTLVMRWSGIEPPGDSPQLWYAPLAPWEAWPDEPLDIVYLADLHAGAGFRAAEADDDRFAALFTRSTDATLRFSIEVPEVSADTSIVVATSAETPLFASYAGQAHLLGYQEQSQARVRRVVGGVTLGSESIVGCAATRLVADAAAVGDGWLIAASIAEWPCPTQLTDAAKTLAVWRQPFSAEQPSMVGDPIVAPGVSRVKLVPQADGAWLIWQAGGNDADVLALRLDAFGHPTTGDVITLIPAGIDDLVTARRMGAYLLLLTRVAQGSSTPGEQLRLTVFDAQAGQVLAVWLPIDGLMLGADVLASPAGDHALVAFAETFDGRWRVATARLDCTLPL
jgi:hypothetical protein